MCYTCLLPFHSDQRQDRGDQGAPLRAPRQARPVVSRNTPVILGVTVFGGGRSGLLKNDHRKSMYYPGFRILYSRLLHDVHTSCVFFRFRNGGGKTSRSFFLLAPLCFATYCSRCVTTAVLVRIRLLLSRTCGTLLLPCFFSVLPPLLMMGVLLLCRYDSKMLPLSMMGVLLLYCTGMTLSASARSSRGL